MANTEKFCVIKVDIDTYENKHCHFKGTMEQAKLYANAFRYGGGVLVIKDKTNKKKVKSC